MSLMIRFSDCITLFQNQEVMNAVVRQKQAGLGRAAASQVSLTEINAQIANCIAGLMLPTSNISGDGDRLVFDELKVPDMRTTLTPLMPIPDCKVLEMATSMQLPMTTRTASFANGHKALGSSWDDLASDLMRSLSVPATGARRRCMAARLQARGVVGAEYWKRIERIKSKFETKLGVDSQSLNLSASATYGWSLQRLKTPPGLIAINLGFNIKSPKASLELLTNSSMTGAYLENTLAKAAAMYENRAYVHWYERYGGSEVHGIFEECFETLASARDAYASTN
ncbi:hypothetical protein DFS34DRAFT_591587 [Phlyctochytrium arcticum]|nr:hypothetical protein DFS34DRAFT_591587 [Phlyctochytrium arcticum]